MKTVFIKVNVSILLFFLAACASSKPVPSAPAQLPKSEPILDFEPPVPEEWTLANGLKVMYLYDEELPVVNGTLYTRGGSLLEPADAVGSYGAMGDQMRSGGAGPRSADELDKELVALSAGVGSSVSAEFGSVNFSTLKTDLDKVFEIFADVALRPRFEQSRLDLWKSQSLEGIIRRTDEPWTVAGIAFNQIVYGGSRYGRVLLSSDVKAINRQDLVTAHKDLIRPDDALMIISGAVPKQKVQELISKYFAGWERREGQLPPIPELGPEPDPGVYFIKQPFSQACIYMGHLGVGRLTADHVAIDAFNQLFGSGFFGARLTKKVRAEMGLAYGIFGGVLPGVKRGKAVIAFQTKSASSDEAIAASLGELIALQKADPAEEELIDVQRAVASSFVFKFDSTEEILARRASQDLLGYPKDYDDTYIPELFALNVDAIKQVANKRWNTNEFVIVVVGDENAYSSMKELMKDPPPFLEGLPLRKVPFKEQAIL